MSRLSEKANISRRRGRQSLDREAEGLNLIRNCKSCGELQFLRKVKAPDGSLPR